MTTLNMHLPVCTLQIACDGARVKTGNMVCHKCKEKQAKRAKPPPPLRGSTTAITQAELLEQRRLKRP